MNESFADAYPELLSEWDFDKNEKGPREYTPLSAKKVCWVCPKGHHYDCTINNRVRRGDGCPYCSGRRVLAGYNDLGTLRPDIAREWNTARNELSPDQVAVNSNKKAWWRCRNCGTEWAAVIANRCSKGSGCPRCGYKKAAKNRYGQLLEKKGSLADMYPELLSEWDYEKNNGCVSPLEVTHGSQVRVWWRCKTCGHEWQSIIAHRVRGSRCPKCSYKTRQMNNRKVKKA